MFRTDIYFNEIFAEICVIQEQMRAAASQNLLFFAKKFREIRNVLTIFANIFEKTKFHPYRFGPKVGLGNSQLSFVHTDNYSSSNALSKIHAP